MGSKFIHSTLRGLERRPMLAALIFYWIALGAAALLLAWAVRQDPRVHLPYLAGIPAEISWVSS
jgi:hypothetical protein